MEKGTVCLFSSSCILFNFYSLIFIAGPQENFSISIPTVGEEYKIYLNNVQMNVDRKENVFTAGYFSFLFVHVWIVLNDSFEGNLTIELKLNGVNIPGFPMTISRAIPDRFSPSSPSVFFSSLVFR